jgi:hypothetical protein
VTLHSSSSSSSSCRRRRRRRSSSSRSCPPCQRAGESRAVSSGHSVRIPRNKCIVSSRASSGEMSDATYTVYRNSYAVAAGR